MQTFLRLIVVAKQTEVNGGHRGRAGSHTWT